MIKFEIALYGLDEKNIIAVKEKIESKLREAFELWSKSDIMITESAGVESD